MIPNGFIIQGRRQKWIEGNCPYRGLGYAESWPLDDQELFKKDPIAEEFSNLVNQKWFGFSWKEEGRIWECYPPSAVPELAFVCKYIQHCQKIGINIRVILCESQRDTPKLDLTIYLELKGKTSFLGYDYCTSQDHFSTILDDFYGVPIPELEPLKKHLNNYGLFATEELVDGYIKNRESALARGENMERDLDFIKFRLSEVNVKILLDLAKQRTE